MKSTKHLGIWMDHSIAHLMEFKNNKITSNFIESQPIRNEKELDLNRDESLLHNKAHNQLSAYYKKLSNVIKDYEKVILFGPTEAKNELLNLLKTDHHFEKIKIETKSADKMTENQQQAFVKEYFNPSV